MCGAGRFRALDHTKPRSVLAPGQLERSQVPGARKELSSGR